MIPVDIPPGGTDFDEMMQGEDDGADRHFRPTTH